MKVEIKPVSKEERSSWPRDVLVQLESPHVDERGSIQPLVDRDMKSCVLISSAKGTVRANHFHKTDWHYCYVLEGKIEYSHRPHGETREPDRIVINKGQLFFTPPMVDHAMEFLENTVFLTLGRNSREQEVYEADVERIQIVPPK